MTKPFVRDPYNYDTNIAGDESALHCQDPTLTQQHFKEECDINTIVKRFNLTGQLPENIRMPTYADFEQVFDFQSAMNAIAQAGEAFDAMPADVRARFHNNPAEFLDFCNNLDNRDEAIKLGLVPPKSPATDNPPAPSGTPEKAPGVAPQPQAEAPKAPA